jgi:hypothetical protein
MRMEGEIRDGALENLLGGSSRSVEPPVFLLRLDENRNIRIRTFPQAALRPSLVPEAPRFTAAARFVVLCRSERFSFDVLVEDER